ncbi:MAG: DUF4931 domain-containing protein [Patescibacteria group bacterium]|jgi:UDPglucose--hexose-1-phosphate uridylyltransferase
MQSEIRKQYFLNKYVIITPGRARRPHEIMEQSQAISDFKCEFCPDTIDKKQLIKTYGKGKTWKIAALRNKYPAVALDNKKAYGIQEVIIDTPEHDIKFSELSVPDIAYYFDVMADRLKEITKDKKIEYVLQFKNHGSKAGATIRHEHSQIFATNILPPDISGELQQAENYKIEHNACPYCGILKNELKSPRKICEDKFIGAFAPYASEYHYEAWIFPKRHLDNISVLTREEKKSLAACLKKILAKIDSLGLAYNFFMHQVVKDSGQHFYIKVQPRDKNVWAGIELGSGLVINSIAPEKAAKFYRS